jgi:hypothetical protein
MSFREIYQYGPATAQIEKKNMQAFKVVERAAGDKEMQKTKEQSREHQQHQKDTEFYTHDCSSYSFPSRCLKADSRSG